MSEPGWFVISDQAFRDALQRAHDGENPDLVFVEVYANSEEPSHE